MALLGPNGQPVGGPSPEPSPATHEDAPPAPTRVTTAFLVYQLPNGQWKSSDDLATPIVPARKPQWDDMIAGTENVKSQVIARQTAAMAAQATVQHQMALMAQAQEAAQNAQIQQMLTNRGK